MKRREFIRILNRNLFTGSVNFLTLGRIGLVLAHFESPALDQKHGVKRSMKLTGGERLDKPKIGASFDALRHRPAPDPAGR